MSGPTPIEVRRAGRADGAAVAATVGVAFEADPAWRWLFADRYDELAPAYAAALFDRRVDAGTVWVTVDVASVAMWVAPREAGRPGAVDRAWAAFLTRAGPEAAGRVEAYDRAIHRMWPSEPFWYLGVLATRPERRRTGLADAVLAPALAEADRDRRPCALETSTDANRAFYRRRGFTEERPLVLAAGPPTWWLERPGGAPGDGSPGPGSA